jgi:hypothetical protein
VARVARSIRESLWAPDRAEKSQQPRAAATMISRKKPRGVNVVITLAPVHGMRAAEVVARSTGRHGLRANRDKGRDLEDLELWLVEGLALLRFAVLQFEWLDAEPRAAIEVFMTTDGDPLETRHPVTALRSELYHRTNSSWWV